MGDECTGERYPVGCVLWIGGELQRYFAVVNLQFVGRLEKERDDPCLRAILENYAIFNKPEDDYTKGKILCYNPLAGLESGRRITRFDAEILERKEQRDACMEGSSSFRVVDAIDTEIGRIKNEVNLLSKNGSLGAKERVKLLEEGWAGLNIIKRLDEKGWE